MSFKHKKAELKREREARRAENAAVKQSHIAKKYVKPAFREYVPKPSKYVESDAMQRTRNLPSHNNGADPQYVPPQTAVFPSERDIAAKKESDKLKTCLAPLYPKGPYQLITDPNAPKYFNKKDGGL